MSVPLRKEQPEFDKNELDENLTTADLAQGKRPATETRLEPTDRLNLKSERHDLEKELKIEDRIENRREDSIEDPRIDQTTNRNANQNLDQSPTQSDPPRPVLAERPAAPTQSTPTAANASPPAPPFPNNEPKRLR